MKFKKHSFRLTKVLIPIGILLSSCIGDNFNFDKLDPNAKISPSYAIHFVYANISFDDIMPEDSSVNQFLELNDDGYLEIYYQADLYTLTAEEQVVVPNQEFPQSLLLTDTELANFNAAYDIVIDREYEYVFSVPQGMHLDSITFSSGFMNVEINSNWSVSLGIGLKLLGFTNASNDTLGFNFPDITNNSVDTTIDLTGYTINLTNNETSKNLLLMDYVLALSQPAGNVFAPAEEMTVFVSLLDIKFETVTGFFGAKTIPIANNTFPIGIGGNTFNAELNLENPQFNIFYENSFNLPVEFSFTSMYTLNADNQATNITLPPDLDPLSFTLPGSDGSSVFDTVSINNTNSTLIQELLNLPKSLTFGGAVKLNNGVDPNEYYVNKLPGDGLFDISVEFRLPLSANFRFAMRDTMEFPALASLDSLIPVGEIETILGIDNGFPISLGVQVFFADSVFTVLDSLFENFSIEGSISGVPEHSEIKNIFSGEKLQNILSARNLIFEIVITSAGFNPPNSPFVQIKDDYEIAFDFAVRVDVDINPADFVGGDE